MKSIDGVQSVSAKAAAAASPRRRRRQRDEDNQHQQQEQRQQQDSPSSSAEAVILEADPAAPPGQGQDIDTTCTNASSGGIEPEPDPVPVPEPEENRRVSLPGAYAVDGPGVVNDEEGSESSAVEAVRATLEAEAAGEAGSTTADGETQQGWIRSTRATSRGSVRSSIRGSMHSACDLSTHPDIEFVAEATLVVEDPDDNNHNVGGDELTSGGNDPQTDGSSSSYEDIHGDGISTLGPPPELSDVASRSTATSGGGRVRRPSRQRGTSAGMTLDATCTSLEESTHHQHATPPNGRDVEEGAIVTAEPMKNKCLMSRRTVIVSVLVGGAVLLAIALGAAIPLVSRNGGGSAPPPSPPSGGNKYFPENNEVLTHAPEPICFSLLPLMTIVSKACPDPTQLPKGGPLCQLVADGLLDASDPAANIDIAIINGGAMRRDIMAGDLTAGTVRKQILPFTQNRIVYLSITPAEIKAGLEGPLFDTGYVVTEEQQRQFFPESPTVPLHWPFESTYPYTAGLRYNVNLTAPEGYKVTNIEINARYNDEAGWTPLDVTDDITLLRVITSDYLAGGGDGYFPGHPKDRQKVVEDLGVTDLFLLYLSRQEELIGPDYIEGMSTREFIPVEGYQEKW